MKGYKLVPVEPTEEMIYAIATGAHRGDSGKEIWSEALAYAADVDWPKRAMEVGLQYVREPDDHYVTATPEQMANLLREVVGIDIRRSNGCGYNESTPPQPIYDEAKENFEFADWFVRSSLDHVKRKAYQACATLAQAKEIMRVGWLACAKSRAKAVEVGHE